MKNRSYQKTAGFSALKVQSFAVQEQDQQGALVSVILSAHLSFQVKRGQLLVDPRITNGG